MQRSGTETMDGGAATAASESERMGGVLRKMNESVLQHDPRSITSRLLVLSFWCWTANEGVVLGSHVSGFAGAVCKFALFFALFESRPHLTVTTLLLHPSRAFDCACH